MIVGSSHVHLQSKARLRYPLLTPAYIVGLLARACARTCAAASREPFYGSLMCSIVHDLS